MNEIFIPLIHYGIIRKVVCDDLMYDKAKEDISFFANGDEEKVNTFLSLNKARDSVKKTLTNRLVTLKERKKLLDEKIVNYEKELSKFDESFPSLTNEEYSNSTQSLELLANLFRIDVKLEQINKDISYVCTSCGCSNSNYIDSSYFRIPNKGE